MSEMKVETVEEFLARGGKITVLPSTRVRGFDKKSLNSPSPVSRKWSKDKKAMILDDMYKCGFFKS